MTLLILLACLLLNIIECANIDHLVNKSLPGIDPTLMQTNWYSGSYKVSRNRGLHYLFIESERDKATDPIVIFMSGGPSNPSILLSLQYFGPVTI